MSPETDRPATPEQIAAVVAQATTAMSYSSQVLVNIVAYRRRCTDDGTDYPRAVHNTLEFVLHLYFDVSSLTADMLSRPADLRAGLYARLAVLTVYEGTHTLQSLLGRELQAEVRDVLGEEQVVAVREAHREMQRVFEGARARFGDIRHGLAGHRDADPDVRLRLIEAATPRAVTDLVIAFLVANLRLLAQFEVYTRRFRMGDA